MHYKPLMLIAFTGLVMACENPSAPGVTIPGEAQSITQHVYAELYRGYFLKVSFPNRTLVGLTHDPMFSTARALHYINFYCKQFGSGNFYMSLTGDAQIYGAISCRNAFRPAVREPYNLTLYFRDRDGRIVTGISVLPIRLAKQVAMGGASGTLSRTPAPSSAFWASIAADDQGDIGVECEEEGEGTLTVHFSSGAASESIPLECAPAHEQGGGG